MKNKSAESSAIERDMGFMVREKRVYNILLRESSKRRSSREVSRSPNKTKEMKQSQIVAIFILHLSMGWGTGRLLTENC
jgi:hypothetical protein